MVNSPAPTWNTVTQIFNWQASGLLQQVSFNTPQPSPNPNGGSGGSSTPPATQVTTTVITSSANQEVTGPVVNPQFAVDVSIIFLIALGVVPLGLFVVIMLRKHFDWEFSWRHWRVQRKRYIRKK
ncbi:MAG: hypothetical protein M1587_05525 [Thaumarchaeota archaeon]|nr:hypothetical protein [Nitrososphaerota archaeon]